MAYQNTAHQFLYSLSDLDLILETKAAIKKERFATAVVIRYFQEIEDRKLYLAHSCSSLFEFATQHLGYCAGSAQTRINAVRLMRSVPEVETKLESGELSLTAVSKIQSFIFQEKKANKEISISEICEVIDVCANKSTREVERELAKRNPDVLKVEFVKPVGVDRFQLSFSISEELEEKVRKLKGLLAHSNPNLTNEELFERLVELGLEKFDPIRKAQRVARRKAKADVTDSVAAAGARASRDSARAENLSKEVIHGDSISASVARKADKSTERSLRARETKLEVDSRRLFECDYPIGVEAAAKTNAQAKQSFHAQETNEITSQRFRAHEMNRFEFEHQFEFGLSEIFTAPGAVCESEPVIDSKGPAVQGRYVPADARHEAWLKNDNRGCEFENDSGHVCGSHHALQLDHVNGFARGGLHDVENLRVLCAKHNRFVWKSNLVQ